MLGADTLVYLGGEPLGDDLVQDVGVAELAQLAGEPHRLVHLVAVVGHHVLDPASVHAAPGVHVIEVGPRARADRAERRTSRDLLIPNQVEEWRWT